MRMNRSEFVAVTSNHWALRAQLKAIFNVKIRRMVKLGEMKFDYYYSTMYLDLAELGMAGWLALRILLRKTKNFLLDILVILLLLLLLLLLVKQEDMDKVVLILLYSPKLVYTLSPEEYGHDICTLYIRW